MSTICDMRIVFVAENIYRCSILETRKTIFAIKNITIAHAFLWVFIFVGPAAAQWSRRWIPKPQNVFRVAMGSSDSPRELINLPRCYFVTSPKWLARWHDQVATLLCCSSDSPSDLINVISVTLPATATAVIGSEHRCTWVVTITACTVFCWCCGSHKRRNADRCSGNGWSEFDCSTIWTFFTIPQNGKWEKISHIAIAAFIKSDHLKINGIGDCENQWNRRCQINLTSANWRVFKSKFRMINYNQEAAWPQQQIACAWKFYSVPSKRYKRQRAMETVC